MGAIGAGDAVAILVVVESAPFGATSTTGFAPRDLPRTNFFRESGFLDLLVIGGVSALLLANAVGLAPSIVASWLG